MNDDQLINVEGDSRRQVHFSLSHVPTIRVHSLKLTRAI